MTSAKDNPFDESISMAMKVNEFQRLAQIIFLQMKCSMNYLDMEILHPQTKTNRPNRVLKHWFSMSICDVEIDINLNFSIFSFFFLSEWKAIVMKVFSLTIRLSVFKLYPFLKAHEINKKKFIEIHSAFWSLMCVFHNLLIIIEI